MYNYNLKIEGKNGNSIIVTYQKIIIFLKIENEYLHGAKLKNGGVPQVQSVISIIKKADKNIKNITAYFQGTAILSV